MSLEQCTLSLAALANGSLARKPLVVRQRLSRRFLGERDRELEDEESETRALGALSLTAGEAPGVARVFGGERRTGFVSGQTGMAFNDGVLDRERARGAQSCVPKALVQPKSLASFCCGL